MSDPAPAEEASPEPEGSLETVVTRAENLAIQISKLAADPDVDDNTVERVVQVVKKAMTELAVREKDLLSARAAAADAEEEATVDVDCMTDSLIRKPIHVDTEPEENLQNRHRDVCYLLALNLICLTYIAAFACIFWHLERDQKWTLIDGWFFAVVTIGTVGYGVLIPGSEWTQAVVVIYLAMGAVFFIFSMSLATDVLLGALEDVVKNKKLHKYCVCGPRVLGMSSVLFLIITSGVCYGVFFEEWSFIESMYWTIVTITTVGYGDYAPTTQSGRMIVSFFILLGCGAFAAIIAGVVASYISIRHRAAALIFMMEALTPEKLAQMPKNKDGYVTRTEFVEYMLIKLSYIGHSDVDLMHECFNAMDADGSGELDMVDVAHSNQGQLLMEKIRLQYGITPGDRNLLPLGFFGIRSTFVKEKITIDKDLDEKIQDGAKRSAFRTPRSVSYLPVSKEHMEPAEKVADVTDALVDSVVPSFSNDEQRLAALKASIK